MTNKKLIGGKSQSVVYKPITNTSFSFNALNGKPVSTSSANSSAASIVDKENTNHTLTKRCTGGSCKQIERYNQQGQIQKCSPNVAPSSRLKKHKLHTFRQLRRRLDNYDTYPDVYIKEEIHINDVLDRGSPDGQQLTPCMKKKAKRKILVKFEQKNFKTSAADEALSNKSNNTKPNYRKLWRKVFLYIIAAVRMRVKPPEGYIRTNLTDLFRFTVQAMFNKVLIELLLYVQARDKWRYKDLTLKNMLFHAWFIWAKAKANFRSHCQWAYSRWNRIVKIRQKKRNLFRSCFWPLFTWRKHIKLQILLRAKVTMISRIWIQYIQIKSLRAWKLITKQRLKNRFSVKLCKEASALKIQRIVLYTWRCYTHKCRAIRHAWNETGSKLRKQKNIQLFSQIITVWRYYSFCSCQMKRISLKHFRCISYTKNCPKYMDPHVFSSPPESQHKLIPEIPFVHQTSWAFPQSVNTACVLVHDKFEKKKISNMLFYLHDYKRLCPFILHQMYAYSVREKKCKAARSYFETILLKRYFMIFKSMTRVGIQASDEYPVDVSLCYIQTKHYIDCKEYRKQNHERNAQTIEYKNYQLQAMKVHAFITEKIQVLKKTNHETEHLITHLSLVNSVIPIEIKQTLTPGGLIHNFAEDFHYYATKKFLQTICDIYAKSIQRHNLFVTKRYFREIRSATLMRSKINHICSRNRLRKWLNKCTRFRKIQNSIEVYYKLKLKISYYNHWLSYLHYVYTSRTKGLRISCKLLQQRIAAYDQYLRSEKVFYFRTFISHKSILFITSTAKAIFLRWSSYSARKTGLLKLNEIFLKRRNNKVLYRCFNAWKKKLFTFNSCNENGRVKFLMRRLTADEETIRKYILFTMKRSLSLKIQAWNLNYRYKLQESAITGPSLKKYLSLHVSNVYCKLEEEKKTLENWFENRGMMEFTDMCYVARFAETGYDSSWIKFWQENDFVQLECVREYFNRKLKYRYWFDSPLSAGCRLSEIWVTSKIGHGVIGLRYFVSRGGMQVMAGARGQCNFGVKECFEVKEGEHLVKVEVVRGEAKLECIRFSTSSGRTSVWYGEKNWSIASQVVTLQSNAEESPLNNNSCYIIGFFGREESLSGEILSLGIIVRKVSKFSVFSYHWQNSTSECLSEARQEFEVLLKLRRIDVMNVLDRSVSLARTLWKSSVNSKFVSRALPPLDVVKAITTWFFDALSLFHLLPISESEKRNNESYQGVPKSAALRYFDDLVTKAKTEMKLIRSIQYLENDNDNFMVEDFKEIPIEATEENTKSFNKVSEQVLDRIENNNDNYVKKIEKATKERLDMNICAIQFPRQR